VVIAMRLTLRTLLAYMDDILDPNDHEELGKKIEASPFATELIHRSRDAVRRLRLSAPAVLASESGDLHDADHNMDANTAAEYLDSILSPDDVAEFERSCLEAGPNADMLLAEAVSCHHILTLVLGEPAEVDGDLRQRMYELSKFSAPAEVKHTRIEPAHGTPAVQAAAATPVAPVAAVASAPLKQRVDPDEATMPDYMLEAERARRSGRRRLVGALLVAFVLGAAGTAVIFPGILSPEVKVPDQAAKAERDIDKLEQGVEVGDAAAPGEPQATDNATTAGTTGDVGGEAPPFDPGAEAPPFNPGAATTTNPTTPALPPEVDPGSAAASSAADDATAGEAAAGDATATSAPPATGGEGTAGATVPAATTDPATTDGTTTTPPAAPTPPIVEPPADTTPAPADDAAGTGVLPTGLIPSPVDLPPGDVPPAGDDSLMTDDAAAAVDGAVGPPADPAPGAIADAGAPTDAADEGASVDDAAAAAAAPPEDERPQQAGAYLGNDDVLLRFEPASSAWIRLPPRSSLAPGDRLLVFPTFRTHVVLGKDVNAFIAGGTEVTVGNGADAAGDASADFSLEIPFGRMILNSGAGGNRIALVMGDEVRVIELGASSSLAVDVKRRFVPGTDPTQEAYPLEINYYLTTGSASWGDGQSAEGQATWTTFDGADATAESIDELPDWINGEALSGLEKSANEEVLKSLAAGQPVNISLLELTDPKRRGKRAEVRSLAGKCASYVGEFEPLVNALGDMVDRPWWKERIETLREAVARDASSVEPIANVFAVQKGEKATDDLVKMVLGYDSEEVGTTRDSVQEGALVRLIYWLDHEDPTYRVLASYNVNEITGTMLGGYRPEHPASKRKGEIRFYTERFDKGDLMPRPWTARGWAPR
jgi:hypothetical protein